MRMGGYWILGVGGLLLSAVACGAEEGTSDGDATGGSATGGATTGTGGVAATGATTGSGGATTGTGGETTGTGGEAMGGAGTGGASGNPACDTYCNGADGVVQVCGTTLATGNPFTSEADCVTQCNAQSKWNLTCRQQHLDMAGTNLAFHCPHTIGQDGQCADAP